LDYTIRRYFELHNSKFKKLILHILNYTIQNVNFVFQIVHFIIQFWIIHFIL